MDWWWCPKPKMSGKFDGMYMNYSSDNNDKWAQEKGTKKSTYK